MSDSGLDSHGESSWHEKEPEWEWDTWPPQPWLTVVVMIFLTVLFLLDSYLCIFTEVGDVWNMWNGSEAAVETAVPRNEEVEEAVREDRRRHEEMMRRTKDASDEEKETTDAHDSDRAARER